MQVLDAGDIFDVVLDAKGNIIGVVRTDCVEMQEGKDGVWRMKTHN